MNTTKPKLTPSAKRPLGALPINHPDIERFRRKRIIFTPRPTKEGGGK